MAGSQVFESGSGDILTGSPGSSVGSSLNSSSAIVTVLLSSLVRLQALPYLFLVVLDQGQQLSCHRKHVSGTPAHEQLSWRQVDAFQGSGPLTFCFLPLPHSFDSLYRPLGFTIALLIVWATRVVFDSAELAELS